MTNMTIVTIETLFIDWNCQCDKWKLWIFTILCELYCPWLMAILCWQLWQLWQLYQLWQSCHMPIVHKLFYRILCILCLNYYAADSKLLPLLLSSLTSPIVVTENPGHGSGTPAGDNSPHVELPSSKHCTFLELPVYENDWESKWYVAMLGVWNKGNKSWSESSQLVIFFSLLGDTTSGIIFNFWTCTTVLPINLILTECPKECQKSPLISSASDKHCVVCMLTCFLMAVIMANEC